MYYRPKHFKTQEIFSRRVIQNHPNNSIWRLMDSRVIWTLDKLRDLFGTMIVNDYIFGGDMEQRGFRDPIELIDMDYFNLTGITKAKFSSFSSQHCFGRAIDSSLKKVLVEDARKYIIKNKHKEDFKFIKGLELNVSWLHFDTRNYQNKQKGFLLF